MGLDGMDGIWVGWGIEHLTVLKITRETPEVRSDKGKPREKKERKRERKERKREKKGERREKN